MEHIDENTAEDAKENAEYSTRETQGWQGQGQDRRNMQKKKARALQSPCYGTPERNRIAFAFL